MSSNAEFQLLAYGLCAVMLAFAGILRKRCGTWSNPSVVFALFWGLMTLMPVFFVHDLQPSLAAIAYINAAVIAFGSSAFLISWKKPIEVVSERQAVNSSILGRTESIWILLMVEIAVLACMIANVAYQGFSVWNFFVDPFLIGCEYLGYKYRGDVKPFLFAQAGTVLNYVAAALAGLIVANRRSFALNAFVVIAGTMPSFYSVAVFADKGTIFLTLAFFYGAVVMGRIRNGNTALVTWRTVYSAPLVLAVVALAIGFAMVNRHAASCDAEHRAELADRAFVNPEATSGIGMSIRSYAFGHLFAFSSWFDHRLSDGATFPTHSEPDPEFVAHYNTSQSESLYRNPEGLTLGFWTFMAVGKIFNPDYYTSLSDGYYEEYFLRTGVLQTNIYTFFRGLINDFSVPGSLLFLSVFGFVMNLAYRNVLMKAFAPLSQATYVFFAGYLYTSYIISLLIWNSVIASGVATFIMLLIIGYVDRHGGSLIGVVTLRHLRTDSSGVGR